MAEVMSALRMAPREQRRDRDFVRAQVSKDGLALGDAAEELQQDKEIARIAVEQNGMALQFVGETLKRDLEIVLTAVSQDAEALQFADPRVIAEHRGLRALQAREGIGYCDPYLITDRIGAGVYGAVTKARHISTGEVVAIKRLFYDPCSWLDGIPTHVLREVSALMDLEHPNVLRLVEVLDPGMRDFRLVTEYVDTDLHQVLRDYRKKDMLMPLGEVRKFSRMLLSGIQACHLNLLIHRDLKPQNLLVSREGVLKIADFGLARLLMSPMRNYTLDVVTLWYRAPELLLGATKYTLDLDIWSAGCVIAEMATGRPLFNGDSEIGTIFKIFQLLGTPNKDHWKEALDLEHFKIKFPVWPDSGLTPLLAVQPELKGNGLDLIRQLLQYNPQDRLKARRAMEHRFLQEL